MTCKMREQLEAIHDVVVAGERTLANPRGRDMTTVEQTVKRIKNVYLRLAEIYMGAAFPPISKV